MCVRLVSYNTYGDGSRDVTETINTCAGGMCARPELRESHHKYRFTKDHGTYHHTDFMRLPPTPHHSKSPSPSRSHKTAVYINDKKVADIPLAAGIKRRHSTHTHAHTHADRADRERERVILHAPDPPAPLLPRSTTMPTEYLHVERPAHRRSHKADAAEYTHYHGSGHHHHHHHRRHAPTEAADFVYVDDEREKRERRRGLRRTHTTTQPRSSSKTATAAAGPAPSKNLRWADELDAEIAAQNERISARPALHQQVKGILKNARKDDADYRELRRRLEHLDMADQTKHHHHKTSRKHSGSPHSPQLGSSDSDYDYDPDKLRARFGDDPRERRRRSRVSYGAGMYNYQ